MGQGFLKRNVFCQKGNFGKYQPYFSQCKPIFLSVIKDFVEKKLYASFKYRYSGLVLFIIFRPYFMYGKGKYLNQTGFFTKFAKNLFIFNLKGVTPRIQLT